MTYVSQKPLSKKVLKRIGDLLVFEVAKAKTASQANTLIDALLTDAERIMLAKRFAIVILLKEDAGYKYIQNVLKVSSATIFRIQKLCIEGEFNDLVAHTYKKQKSGKVRDGDYNKETAFEVLIRAGMPPMGKGRWRAFYKRTENIKRK